MAVVYERAIWRTSHPKPKKTIKRNHPKKILKFFKFLKKFHFWKWNFLAQVLKRFLYFLKRKLFLYFSKRKLFLYSRERNFLALVKKKEIIFYISRNGTLHFSAQALKLKEIHSGKIYCTSGNGNPLKILIFQQTETLKKLLIFQEVTYKTRKNKKKFAVRKFLVSYDVLVIFTLVEHMEISFEAKIKVLLCLHYELFNYLCYTIK